jgi:hypothetical protein
LGAGIGVSEGEGMSVEGKSGLGRPGPAVFTVPNNWVTEVGEMHADLVLASGQQVKFQK